MGKASESLGKQQVGQAPPSQQEAMNALGQTLKNLRQAAKPKPAERSGTRNAQHDKVEIPSGDEHAAPAAFREELMKAMKGKTAESNEERYGHYRSLVE